MTLALPDLLVFLALTLVIGIAGVGFGIFFVAPRLSRFADHPDEDPGARDN